MKRCFVAVVVALSPFAALADSPAPVPAACLSSDEMREAVAAGHAIAPTAATRAARRAADGEILRVRLCRHEDALVYRVTMLQRDGRVGHVTIDGVSGKVDGMR
jgi:uncharacterized iron-regulated membrane protein